MQPISNNEMYLRNVREGHIRILSAFVFTLLFAIVILYFIDSYKITNIETDIFNGPTSIRVSYNIQKPSKEEVKKIEPKKTIDPIKKLLKKTITKKPKPIIEHKLVEEKPTINEKVLSKGIIANTEIKLKQNTVMQFNGNMLVGNRVAPKYHPRALKLNQEGIVIIELILNPNGTKKSITIKKSSGFRLLDNSALEAIKDKWTFKPRSNTNIIEIPFQFKIER